MLCQYESSTDGTVLHDAGEMALDKLEEKWGEHYPIVIKSWRDNWNRLSEFFQYSEPIRKLIYTTNTVEGYHRQIRKVTKNKGVFPNDTALIKLVYLAYRNARKKMDDACPELGHDLTTACAKVRRQIQFAIDLLYLHR